MWQCPNSVVEFLFCQILQFQRSSIKVYVPKDIFYLFYILYTKNERKVPHQTIGIYIYIRSQKPNWIYIHTIHIYCITLTIIRNSFNLSKFNIHTYVRIHITICLVSNKIHTIFGEPEYKKKKKNHTIYFYFTLNHNNMLCEVNGRKIIQSINNKSFPFFHMFLLKHFIVKCAGRAQNSSSSSYI